MVKSSFSESRIHSVSVSGAERVTFSRLSSIILATRTLISNKLDVKGFYEKA
jgi:hypothetical protein